MSAHVEPATPEQQYHQALSDCHVRQTIRTIPDLRRESSREELAAIKYLDALDIDDRPTFAIRAQPPLQSDDDAPLDLIYSNTAFNDINGLLERVTGQSDVTSVFVEHELPQQAFRRWLRGVADARDFARRGNAYMFEGFIWAATTTGDFKFVSGLHASLLWPNVLPDKPYEHDSSPKNMPVQGRAPTVPPTPFSRKSSGQTPTTPLSGTNHGPYDATSSDPNEAILSDHVQQFRSVDWAQTPLGSMTTWKPELRNVVNMCLNDLHPCMLFWGDDVTMIYNEAYVQLLGAMHPYAIGKSARQIASDYWHTFQPLVDHINATGKSLCENEIPIFIDRHGFLEETYWSFQFIPVLDCDGHVAGYFHPLFETTKHNLLERRVSSLVELGSQTAKARTLQSYWDLALRTLKLNEKDVPFALLYAAESQCSSDFGSVSSPGSIAPIERYVLKGAIGVQPNHAIAPLCIDLKDGSGVLLPFVLQAMKSRKATIVNFGDLDLSQSQLSNINWKGYGDACRTIVVCPLTPTTNEQVEGILILGINPRRPFDEEYKQFVHVMMRLLATSLASVVLFDEEVRQKEKAIGQAAELQEQLLAELQIREKRFQRFAERADVAIFILDASGKYTYRNQRWYDLFEVAVGDDDVMGAWLNIAFAEDIARCEGLFGKLVMQKEAVSFELRTKMPWLPPPDTSQPESEAVEHFRWVLCSAYPELSPNGELLEIVGNVTDISKQKWAEGIQKIRTDVALESKQHLEHFIDTTSHEMRNPLSAIMQSADGILVSYTSDVSSPSSSHAWSAFLEQTLDAAQTIAQCAQHMRHIVDDILTISKLDSGLLVITPIDSQPEILGRHAVKMFEVEAKAARVELSFNIDESYRNMELNWVSLDPTRLLQILINLLTNAIKFTRLEPTRKVDVTLFASETAPVSVAGGLHFNEEKLVGDDHHLKDDWKQDGNLVFIQFSVKDTGRGLSEEERGSLFARFSQASPRTHIHYGGSGLGLFISRRLTELQGGAIGLESEPKRGSTFSFYIKTRRIKPAMLRTGSMLNFLPEDVRHRPQTPLTNTSRPPLWLSRRSSHQNDDRSCSTTPPSPLLRRQSSFHRRSSLSSLDNLPELSGPSLLQNIQESERIREVPATMHVLVVEDNLVNQRVLAKQLRNLGCVVHVANHGREAIDFLEKTVLWKRDAGALSDSRHASVHIPCTEPMNSAHSGDTDLPIEISVILMDWEMPIMNGLEAVKQIRLLELEGILTARVPVIGVTANVRQQQIQTAIGAGMDDVVGKPFKVAELLVRMKEIVKDTMIDPNAFGLGITSGFEQEGMS